MSRRNLSPVELFVAGLCVAGLLLWIILGSERCLWMTLGFVSILFILRVCSRNNENA